MNLRRTQTFRPKQTFRFCGTGVTGVPRTHLPTVPNLLWPGRQIVQDPFPVASWEESEGQGVSEGWGREAGFSFEVCRL